MVLNVAGGNMYPWVDYTTNPLAGKCPHDCTYCYMKRPPVCWSKKYVGPQRVYEKELKVKLNGLKLHRTVDLPFVPKDMPVIFLCSGNDLGAAPKNVKVKILTRYKEEDNIFVLLQNKNPWGFKEVEHLFPKNVIIGTTLETNREDLCRAVSKAPEPYWRARSMLEYKEYHEMISVEPKMACEPDTLACWINTISPDFVSVGADSGKNNLVEPTAEEIQELIARIDKNILVFKKDNLRRILPVMVN